MTPIKLYIKGFLMGTADIIPGISGGTVALLLGIYKEFIHSLAAIRVELLFKFKIKDFIETINWKFFLPLGLGIVTAVFSLSHLLSWLLQDYPIYIWSLFFGLVFTSVLYLIKKYKCYLLPAILFMIIGAALGYSIASSESILFPILPHYLLIGGVLASLAMILPGISGSYILVLIGLYRPVLASVKNFDLLPLCIFASGVAIGIVLGSKILKRLFSRYPTQVYAVLFGFILGSLPKIWPWHSVSGELSFPLLQSERDLIGLVIMGVSAVFVFATMRAQPAE